MKKKAVSNQKNTCMIFNYINDKRKLSHNKFEIVLLKNTLIISQNYPGKKSGK